MSKPRLIAFYLPQFYPTKENDEWWQKGFTEWTNVGNARPLFKGHYQPRVPADLGYYDLRVPEVREEQAQLAREAGIEGFCYWHYWFAGRRLLDRVFTEVLESGKPDFPFCLCWANHSWYQKTWDPTKPDKLLIEQTYPGEQDYINHFNAMLPAFRDKRYMSVNGKLLFGLYDPIGISKDEFICFKNTWNRLAKDNGLEGFLFWGFTYRENQCDEIIKKGFDNVTVDYIYEPFFQVSLFSRCWKRINRFVTGKPDKIFTYDNYTDCLVRKYDSSKPIFPCLVPNFDHSPRSKERALILHNSTPQKWGNLCSKILNKCSIPNAGNIVFIKAWNEWGEGNYLEPDMKYKRGYLDELKKVYDNIE